MSINIKETALPGVLIIESDIHSDQRGFFRELYHRDKYVSHGLETAFVQDNHSHSVKGVLRGLHYQLKSPQGKLIMAVTGEIYDVAVDIRTGSPDFGKWTGVYLSPLNNRQLFVPEGFAHGFCVLSERADVVYKCTEIYHPGDEYGLIWSDPEIGINWPLYEPVLSERDGKNPELKDIPHELLPVYV